MKSVLIILLFSIKSYSQDSVTAKVNWSKKVGSKVHYVFNINGEKVKSTCQCKERRKKGDTVRVAVKDIQFIKPDL